MRRELVEEEVPAAGPAVSRAPLWILGTIVAVMLFGLFRATGQSGSQANAMAEQGEREARPDENGARVIAELAKEEDARRAAAAEAEARERAHEAVSAAASAKANVPIPPADDKLSVVPGTPVRADEVTGDVGAWEPLPNNGASTSGSPANGTQSPEEMIRAAQQQMRLRVAQHRLDAREKALFEEGDSLEIRSGGELPGRARGLEADESAAVDAELGGADSQIAGLRQLTKGLLDQRGEAMQARGEGLAALGGGVGQLLGGATQDPESLLNNREAKNLDFFQRGGEQLRPGVLANRVEKARGPYTLLMGAVIPGVLITQINSDLPGQIRGRVSKNVFDSATGKHLLIPQNTDVVGTYSGSISLGQERVQVAAVRLNFPNGDTLDLPGMCISDPAGASGLRDQIDRHFWPRVAAALLGTAATVGYEVTAPRNMLGMEGAVHRGLGESVMQMIQNMSSRNQQQPPTLFIRNGARFSIQVSKDILFPGPYEDGFAHRSRQR
jgi:type IV secretory pathway VirB10-like protein